MIAAAQVKSLVPQSATQAMTTVQMVSHSDLAVLDCMYSVMYYPNNIAYLWEVTGMTTRYIHVPSISVWSQWNQLGYSYIYQ